MYIVPFRSIRRRRDFFAISKNPRISEKSGKFYQGGSGIEKKDPGSNFFPLTLGGLTNYVIRHMSRYGNNMSSAAAIGRLAMHC
jgi:hypothetical protein